MKKHLIAAAVAAAVAAPAMAQNVTLYGTIDSGIASLSNIGANKVDGTVFTDGSVASSVWGIRGSEDLGGGLRAVFDAQSDLFTNNGGTSQHGLFRRAANVGVAGGMGEVRLGVHLNPIIAINGALMPMGGNSSQTLLATAMSYHDFFTKNAVTYTSPNLGGLVVQGQYGFGNSLTAGSQGGNVIAGSAVYTMGGLTFRAAMQDRKDNGVASSANAALTAAQLAAGAVGPATAGFDAKAYVAGVTYAMGPWTLAAAKMNNREAAALNGAKTERSGYQYGLAYQMSPALRVGGSFAKSETSSLTNLQAQYTLSKRTRLYANYGMADNGSANTVNFLPYAANTNFAPSQVVDGMTAGTANQRSTAVGGGVIHTF